MPTVLLGPPTPLPRMLQPTVQVLRMLRMRKVPKVLTVLTRASRPTVRFTKPKSLLRASTPISQLATKTVRTTTSCQPQVLAQVNSSRDRAT